MKNVLLATLTVLDAANQQHKIRLCRYRRPGKVPLIEKTTHKLKMGLEQTATDCGEMKTMNHLGIPAPKSGYF